MKRGINTVFLISAIPFSERVLTAMMYSEWKSVADNVVLLSVAKLYFKKGLKYKSEIDNVNIFDIESFSKLKKQINVNDAKDIIVTNFHLDLNSFRIFWVIKRSKNFLFHLYIPGFPTKLIDDNSNKIKTLIKYIKKPNLLINVIKQQWHSFWADVVKVGKPDCAFFAGTSNKIYEIPSFPMTHPDVIRFNRIPESNILRKPYTVFIDEYLYLHPDFVKDSIINRNSWFKNAERHFHALRTFFDFYEEQNKMKVVIALHPENKENTQNLFGSDRVFHNDTPSAIKGAELVMSFASTAISFAVLAMKPIMFLQTDIFYEDFPNLSVLQKYIRNELGQGSINIESMDNSNKLLFQYVNEEKYRNYIKRYLGDINAENNYESIISVDEWYINNRN